MPETYLSISISNGSKRLEWAEDTWKNDDWRAVKDDLLRWIKEGKLTRGDIESLNKAIDVLAYPLGLLSLEDHEVLDAG